ncbi:MAG TPA: fused MFS/spermidine synthase [Gemmatimonadaceae bacterium]|nr:fused MFS/spermidine synthase [Gemmatimonadaceae bacterium]
MIILLYAVFILSGAAGLIYESIWSRYLGLFVGHSAYAQIIVLAIFLGGMSVGAMAVGRRSERLRDPLLGYALVELAVGLIGLAFHPLFGAATRVAYDVLFPPLAGSAALTVAKWGVASLLILPQSVLLGTTFPLMSAGALRHVTPGTPGRTLSMLYFANSLGAAFGVLAAGFWLLRVAGLPGTLAAAAAINIVVAVVTFAATRLVRRAGARTGTSAMVADRSDADAIEIAAARGGPPPMHENSTPPADLPHHADAPAIDSARASAEPAPIWRLLLVVSFGTAVASFIYEIAWIRMLSLVLGSATHSFELMLSAFILGLALGALWIRTRADRLAHPVRALAIVQLVMGLAALATLPIYLESFRWMAALLDALDLTESGYHVFTITRYAFCLAVMLPATFCAGMTLPLITRTLFVSGMGERAIGAVYGINTLGSIAGVVLAGLILLPAVGLKTLLIEGAALDMALGILLLRAATDRRSARGRRLLLAGAAAAVAGVVLADRGVAFDPNLLGSGVFRYGRIPERGSRTIVYHRDGRTATVTVGRSGGWTFISTNGKPDASLDGAWLERAPDDSADADTGLAPVRRPLGGDESTQALLPLISLAHRPGAATAAVIGQGSGMTSHFLLGSPRIREVVTIEIEPAMIEGSRRAFYPANRRVFDDPRAHFVIDDAKSYFASGRRRFDLIISEPSNPWVSGVSGLFTAEFYDRVRRYLAPGGLFAQWLHLYEIDDDLVLSVLAALHHSFPAYQVFQTSKGDILILAGNDASLPAPDWSVFSLPAISADLAGHIPFTPRQLEATRALDRAALAPLLDDWRARNSDFHPLLDLGAERTRYLRQSATGMGAILEGRFDIVAPFFGRRAGFGADIADPAPQIARIDALATGAALRAPREAVDSGRLAGDEDLRIALQRQWALHASLAAGTPPRDWRLWLNSVLTTERDIHGGTAGVADGAFYDAVQGFAARHGAPPEVRDALAFWRALAEWDFPAAARLADALVPAAQGRLPWIAPDDLRDGAVVARLRTGDIAGARRIFTELAPRSERAATNLRTRLLEAYIRAAELERGG